MKIILALMLTFTAVSAEEYVVLQGTRVVYSVPPQYDYLKNSNIRKWMEIAERYKVEFTVCSFALSLDVEKYGEEYIKKYFCREGSCYSLESVKLYKNESLDDLKKLTKYNSFSHKVRISTNGLKKFIRDSKKKLKKR